MTKQSDSNQPMPAEPEIKKAEIDELRRDMRSAQVAAWVERNRRPLAMGLGVFVIVLIAIGYWQEHSRSQSASAATVYEQALQQTNSAQRQALLHKLIEDFPSSSYAAMAEMELAALDDAHAEAHLQALLQHSKSSDIWKWQARLDLAELYIAAGKKDQARAMLEARVGKAYEQLRQYYLALLADDAAQRVEHLQRALDAESHDDQLKTKIERLLGEAKTSQGTAS